MSWTPLENSTATRIHSEIDALRAPIDVRTSSVTPATPLTVAAIAPTYVARLSGTSEKDVIASKASRKSAG